MPLFQRKQSGTNITKQSPSIFRTVSEELRATACQGDVNGVLECLRRGAKFVPDKEGRSALHMAAVNGHAEVFTILIENGCDINAQDKLGYCGLQRACIEGHLEIIRLLLDHNANMDKQDIVQENTALHEAAWAGHSAALEYLLQAKANPYIRNKSGSTPLHLACQNGHNQCCRLLIQHGCKIDVKDRYDDTPLHTSCRYLHSGATKILLNAGASTSEQNRNGDTALHLAVNLSQRKLTKLLVERNAASQLKNKQGETVMDIAQRKQLKEIGEFLQQSRNVSVAQINITKDRRTKMREKLRATDDNGSWQMFKDFAPYGRQNHQPTQNATSPQIPTCPHLYPPNSGFGNGLSKNLQPLNKGEQYFVDLAGHVHKGPIGTPCACYCAPFFYQLAKQNNDAHLELLDEIDACHHELTHEITDLRHVTERKLAYLNQSVRHTGFNSGLSNRIRNAHQALNATRRHTPDRSPRKSQQSESPNHKATRRSPGKMTSPGHSPLKDISGSSMDSRLNLKESPRVAQRSKRRNEQVLKNVDASSHDIQCSPKSRLKSGQTPRLKKNVLFGANGGSKSGSTSSRVKPVFAPTLGYLTNDQMQRVLTRSKSESEMETDIERERTTLYCADSDENVILSDDSLSNLSEDIYMDYLTARRMKKPLSARTKGSNTLSKVRFRQRPTSNGDEKTQVNSSVTTNSCDELRHSNGEETLRNGSIQSKFEASVSQFNTAAKAFDAESFQESSCTTPMTWSSQNYTAESSSARNSLSSCHSNLSSHMSNTQSFQQSLDSGYGTAAGQTAENFSANGQTIGCKPSPRQSNIRKDEAQKCAPSPDSCLNGGSLSYGENGKDEDSRIKTLTGKNTVKGGGPKLAAVVPTTKVTCEKDCSKPIDSNTGPLSPLSEAIKRFEAETQTSTAIESPTPYTQHSTSTTSEYALDGLSSGDESHLYTELEILADSRDSESQSATLSSFGTPAKLSLKSVGGTGATPTSRPHSYQNQPALMERGPPVLRIPPPPNKPLPPLPKQRPSAKATPLLRKQGKSTTSTYV